MLIARGQARLSPGSASTVWTELRADVQSRLDAGERPVVAMHPTGSGYIVVTPSVVLRGDGIPESFEQMIYGAQRGAVGEIQSIAFSPDRFDIASGEATGYVIVGRAGYAARGVDQAVCDAVEEVTENSGTCQDAVRGGLIARVPEVVFRDPAVPIRLDSVRMAVLRRKRYAVAYGPDRGWAVASGDRDYIQVSGYGRPTMLVSEDVTPGVRTFLTDQGAARTLAIGSEGEVVLTTRTGAWETDRVSGRITRDPAADFEEINRGQLDQIREATGQGTGGSRDTSSSIAQCGAEFTSLAEALTLAGNIDGQVVLQPGSCRWLLVGAGRTEKSADAPNQSAENQSWGDLQSAVQARLDAGERPAIGITPQTDQLATSWVVVTNSAVALGPGLPASFRTALQQAQSESLSSPSGERLEPVGTIHALAFDPERFAIETDGRQVVTGWLAVGDGPGGFRGHGVTPEACEAARQVTGGAGELNCQSPAAAPEASAMGPITMRQGRNKVAVLIHGITSPPQNAPSEHIGEMGHTGHYWGYDFISGVAGSTYAPGMGPSGEPHTLAMTAAQASGGLSVASVSREAWNTCGNLSPAGGACPVTDGLPAGARGDLAPVFSRSAPAWTEPDANRSGYGWTAVMVTFRDGSLHLAQQLPAAIDQIYDTYEAHFAALPTDQQPQLYLLGHSYGGVVSRALTTPMDPAERTPLAPNQLTDEQQRRAAFLRDRIVLVGTLSTPHEGAPTPDYANTMTDMVRGLGDEARSQVDNLPDAAFGSPAPTRNQVVDGLADGVQAAVEFISGYRDVFDDIEAQATANLTFLAPTRAVRSDGSPIPLYTMSGRLPGDRFFWKPRALLENTGSETFDRNNYLVSRLDMIDVMKSGRAGKEAGGLLAIELLIQRLGIGVEPGHPWGRTRDAAMDKTAVPRYSHPESLGNLYTEGKRLAVRLLSYRSGYGFHSDGDVDSDGLVSVTSGHGTSLNAPSWYRTHTGYGGWMPWDVDNHGSLMFNPGNGAWIHNHLLRKAGPLAGPELWSDWPNDAVSRSGERSITLTVDRIQALEDVDPLPGMEQADFFITLQVGDSILEWKAKADDDDVINPNISVTHRTTSSVVPIRISLRDVDGAGFGGEDDELGIAPSSGREVLYAYVDLRTNQVFGDVYGEIGINGAGGPPIIATGRQGINVPRGNVWFQVSTAY